MQLIGNCGAQQHGGPGHRYEERSGVCADNHIELFNRLQTTTRSADVIFMVGDNSVYNLITTRAPPAKNYDAIILQSHARQYKIFCLSPNHQRINNTQIQRSINNHLMAP